jgi:F-type H+-transporting ATPase subunit alpha
METNLFYQGIRPAISVGLSVSRVGSSAQTKATKSVAGSLRVELAQFRELAAFAQFGSDLDADTKRRIARGRLLTEVLKQKQYAPLSVAEQVVMLLAATSGHLDTLKAENVAEAVHEVVNRVKRHHEAVYKKIDEGTKPEDDEVKQVQAVAAEVAGSYDKGANSQAQEETKA